MLSFPSQALPNAFRTTAIVANPSVAEGRGVSAYLKLTLLGYHVEVVLSALLTWPEFV